MKYYFYQFIIVALLLSQYLWAASLPVAAASLRQQTGVALDTPFELVIGDEVQIGEASDSLFVFFAAVLKDTRCSAGETCAKEGEATFQIFVSPEDRSDSEIITIGTASDERTVPYQGYVIELVAVDPSAPAPGENFILIEYHLTLVVRAVESAGAPTPGAGRAPTVEAPPENQTSSGPKPLIVDRCINFTPFDAAAILQEPVNVDEPIGNIIFGPLPTDLMGEEGGVQGFCGYASTTPITHEEIDSSQTHIVTNLGTNHAVVAKHLTVDMIQSSSGTVLTDWFDLFTLTEVVGAANPAHDSDEIFDALYNFAGYFPLLDILSADANAAPSFKVVQVELAKDDPNDEMLWLWQTLEDGYFSMLISRTDLDFDLVAARLGQQVQEKTVLGYSRVILDNLSAPPAPTSATNDNLGCGRLTPDDVAAIVGEPVQGQAVANEQGAGCKYTPVADDLSIDAADFSGRFQTHGLLAGSVPPAAAKQLLSGMIEEFTTGHVTDGLTLAELLAAVEEEAWADALDLIAFLEWDSAQWQVEALKVISDDTLLINGKSGSGWPQFFLLRPHPTGGLYYLTGELRQEIDAALPAIIAAARKFTDEDRSAGTVIEPTQENNKQENKEETNGSATDKIRGDARCPLLSLEEGAALLGEPVQVQAVVGQRGAGCKYFPEAEEAWVAPDDFSPTFESHGILAGVMPTDGAQWLLLELLELLQTDGTAIDEATLTDLSTAINAGAIKRALQQLAALQTDAGEWQIEALDTVSDDTVWMHSTLEGYLLSFFFRTQADGRMVAIAVQLPLDRDVETMRDSVTKVLTRVDGGDQ